MNDTGSTLPEAIPPKDAPGLESWLRRLRQTVAGLLKENKDLRERLAQVEKKTEEEN